MEMLLGTEMVQVTLVFVMPLDTAETGLPHWLPCVPPCVGAPEPPPTEAGMREFRLEPKLRVYLNPCLCTCRPLPGSAFPSQSSTWQFCTVSVLWLGDLPGKAAAYRSGTCRGPPAPRSKEDVTRNCLSGLLSLLASVSSVAVHEMPCT